MTDIPPSSIPPSQRDAPKSDDPLEDPIRLGRDLAEDAEARNNWEAELLAAEPAERMRLLCAALGMAERNADLALSYAVGGEAYGRLLAQLPADARRDMNAVGGRLRSVILRDHLTLDQRIGLACDKKGTEALDALLHLHRQAFSGRPQVAEAAAEVYDGLGLPARKWILRKLRGSAEDRTFVAALLGHVAVLGNPEREAILGLARDDNVSVWSEAARAWGHGAARDEVLRGWLVQALDGVDPQLSGWLADWGPAQEGGDFAAGASDNLHMLRHAHAALGHYLAERTRNQAGVVDAALAGLRDRYLQLIDLRDGPKGDLWTIASAVLALADALDAGLVDWTQFEEFARHAKDQAQPALRLNLPYTFDELVDTGSPVLQPDLLLELAGSLGRRQQRDAQWAIDELRFEDALLRTLSRLAALRPECRSATLEVLTAHAAARNGQPHRTSGAALLALAGFVNHAFDLKDEERKRALRALLTWQKPGAQPPEFSPQRWQAHVAELCAWSSLLTIIEAAADRLESRAGLSALLRQDRAPLGDTDAGLEVRLALLGALTDAAGGGLTEAHLSSAAFASTPIDAGDVEHALEVWTFFEQRLMGWLAANLGSEWEWRLQPLVVRMEHLGALRRLCITRLALPTELTDSLTARPSGFGKLVNTYDDLVDDRVLMLREALARFESNVEISRTLIRTLRAYYQAFPPKEPKDVRSLADWVFQLGEERHGTARADVAALIGLVLGRLHSAATAEEFAEQLFRLLGHRPPIWLFRELARFATRPELAKLALLLGRTVEAAGQTGPEMDTYRAGMRAPTEKLREFPERLQECLPAKQQVPTTVGQALLWVEDVYRLWEDLGAFSQRTTRLWNPAYVLPAAPRFAAFGPLFAARLGPVGGQVEAAQLGRHMERLEELREDYLSAESLETRHRQLDNMLHELRAIEAIFEQASPLIEHRIALTLLNRWRTDIESEARATSDLQAALESEDHMRVYEALEAYAVTTAPESERLRRLCSGIKRWFLQRFNWWGAAKARMLAAGPGWRKPLALLTDVDLWMPRLFVAIMAGFLPLVAESYTWELPLRLPARQLGLVVGAALAASALYLYYEAAHRSTVSERRFGAQMLGNPRLAGVGLLFLFGLAQALVTGLFITSVLGSTVLIDIQGVEGLGPGADAFDRLTFQPLGWLPSGRVDFEVDVFPRVLLLWSAVALFIGLFIQQFWQERGLTERL